MTERREGYKGKYALAPAFDNYHSYLFMARLLGSDALAALDDAYRLVVTSYAYMLGYDLYSEGDLDEPRARELLRYFNAELRPWLDRIMLYLPYPSDAIIIAKEILRRLREKRQISDIVNMLGYVEDVVKIVEAIEGAKGRDYTIQFLLSGHIDERRLEVARKVAVTARLVGQIVGRRLVALRRFGPGTEPAGFARISDVHELARLHPLSYLLLATDMGAKQLATGELLSLKTYAVGSKGVEKPNSLGVVVDASGSMAGEEIVLAAGIAIALFTLLKPKRKRLAFFTTEVHEVVDTRSFIDMLLTIRPGGGTNISRAVSHTCQLWKDVERVVVISDGRDHPPRDACAKVSYVVVTEDGWNGFGWFGVKNAWLVAQKGDRLVVQIH